tara:strand:- start:478 stop:756 length:279 start_codon:yes stop_codon:yes gene_type:complete
MCDLSTKETSDNYVQVVAQLSKRWRVIRCRHDLQWIIQRRSSADLNKGRWVGQSYHMTLESLRASCLGVTARLKTHSSKLLNGAKSLAIKND